MTPRSREEVVRELAQHACCDPDRDEMGIRGAPCGTCVVCGNLKRAYDAGRLAGVTEMQLPQDDAARNFQRGFSAGRLAEREAVVGWLRATAEASWHPDTRATGRHLAGEVERGAHLQPTPGKGER